MKPDVYFRILLVIMGCQPLINGFLMLDFFLSQEILKNISAQALGYGFKILTNRPIEPMKLLPPSISYCPVAYDFVT